MTKHFNTQIYKHKRSKGWTIGSYTETPTPPVLEQTSIVQEESRQVDPFSYFPPLATGARCKHNRKHSRRPVVVPNQGMCFFCYVCGKVACIYTPIRILFVYTVAHFYLLWNRLDRHRHRRLHPKKKKHCFCPVMVWFSYRRAPVLPVKATLEVQGDTCCFKLPCYLLLNGTFDRGQQCGMC